MFIGRLDKIKATIYVILYPGGGELPYIRYIGMCGHMVIGGTFMKAYKLIFLPSNQGE